MAYLDWETYVEVGGGEVSEEAFPVAEAWAEAMLDLWTLDRLHVVDWSAWEERVHLVMARLVDSREAVMAEEGGTPLQSFSNGQDSYTFAEPLMNVALGGCYGYAVDLLPVDLMSACARYNHAGGLR